ncbi:MAG TPA: nuclear transport factor 2 family protein [Ferruginibacter sp.]|nr:nuclear transport factor 2 family protein [Ferruginibacter sp.]
MTHILKKDIAQNFSIGAFDKVFEHLSEDATWEIIGTSHFKGKESIQEHCKQVAEYFRSVDTDFDVHHVVAEQAKVVVNGTARFSREGKELSVVSACDVYIFDQEQKITTIISYCIQTKGIE